MPANCLLLLLEYDSFFFGTARNSESHMSPRREGRVMSGVIAGRSADGRYIRRQMGVSMAVRRGNDADNKPARGLESGRSAMLEMKKQLALCSWLDNSLTAREFSREVSIEKASIQWCTDAGAFLVWSLAQRSLLSATNSRKKGQPSTSNNHTIPQLLRLFLRDSRRLYPRS